MDSQRTLILMRNFYFLIPGLWGQFPSLPMSEINTDQPRRFATRILPWLIAVVFFAIYLFTLNHWVSANSLGLVSQIGGWDGQVPFQAPLIWLITRPLMLLGEQNMPLGANAITALLAAGSIGLLARCVAIFPADRSHAQRIRGQLDGLPLDATLNWVPPLLAAGLLGFQLTFWEHATVVTGEMVNLFLFALAVRCLAQYRLDEREWRLQQFGFVLGLGCANDWSMVAYLPFFLAALIWAVGWELLNARRLVTFAVSVAFGLLLYLLMPIVSAGAPGMPGSFGERFWELLKFQKSQLINTPRSKPLLLGLILLLPVAFVSIRWRSGGTSGTDQKLRNFFLILLRVLWLGAGIYTAYDQIISVRMLVTTNVQAGMLPLLTFSWLGALAVGVSAGWFILIGTTAPERRWERNASGASVLAKVGAAVCVLAVVIVPSSLAWRNWRKVALQNGPVLAQLADDLKRSLPNKASLILTEDNGLSVVLQAGLRRDPSAPKHVLLQTRSAPLAEYRQQLANRYGQEFPGLTTFAKAETNVAGVFLELLYSVAREGRAFYLNPPLFDSRTTFLLESLRVRPQGLIYAVEPYAAGEISPPRLTAEQSGRVVQEWHDRSERLATLVSGVSAKLLTAEIAARIYSRAANGNGVELQRAGRLEDAAKLFALAVELVPENVAAQVNNAVNSLLQKRTVITSKMAGDLDKPLAQSGLSPLAIVEQFGPVDEPAFLSSLALALTEGHNPLARAAAVASSRALELAPDSVSAADAFARAALAAGEKTLAMTAIGNVRRLASTGDVKTDVLAGIELLQARLSIGEGDLKGAENTLVEAWKRFPDESALVEGISDFYSSLRRSTNALLYVDQYLARHKDNDTILARRGGLLVELGRPAEAVEVLDSVLARRPNDFEARLGRGAAQLLLNKPAAARVDFEFVRQMNPNFARALIGLGQACLAEKNEGDAQRHFQKVIEVTPTNSPFHIVAQSLLTKLGNR